MSNRQLVAPPSSVVEGVQINQNGSKGFFFENSFRGRFVHSPFVETNLKFYWFAVIPGYVLNLHRQLEGVEIQEFIAARD